MSWPDFPGNTCPVSQAQFTLGIVGLIFVLLMFSQVTPDVILIGAVTLLLVSAF